MVPASKLEDLYSKLEDLYNELKNAHLNGDVPEIESRDSAVSLISKPGKPDLLLNRTWQQKDLYIFSLWLPAGLQSVKLNLTREYFKQRNTDYYARLALAHLDGPEGNPLQAVYLAFAALKNVLLLYKLLHRIEISSDNDEKLSNGLLRVLVGITNDKEKILAVSYAAHVRLISLGYREIANILLQEIIDEFSALEGLIQPIRVARQADLAAPVSPIKTPPAPPLLIPSIPSFYLDDDGCDNENVIEIEPAQTLEAPSLLVLFSSCLGFLCSDRRMSEESEFEMEEMLSRERGKQGYIRLDDRK